MDFEYAPRMFDGFRLRGTANFNESLYGEGSLAPCYGGQKSTEGCVPNLLEPGTAGQDLDGVPTSVAPRWTASLGTAYETPVSNDLIFGLSVDARYSSSYLSSSFGSPLSRQDEYINLDAGIRVHDADDRWELALIGKNLTNQFVVTGVTDASGTGAGTGTPLGRTADQVGFLALPRTVQLQFTWRVQ